MCADAASVATQLDQYGGLFVGNNAAEVLGDYGIGPNHTLPTGGTARYRRALRLQFSPYPNVDADDGLITQPAVRDAVPCEA